jgi:PhnB protein
MGFVDDAAAGAGQPSAPKRTITPRIVVNDVQGCASFLKSTFGAVGEVFAERPTELVIGDSIVMISSLGEREHFPAFLYIYVDDTDATYQRAVAAGAEVVETPSDQFYGDRRAMVKDRYGNVYQIATPIAS